MKKLALITGGTKGIGKAIADNLTDEYEVVTVGRSDNATEQGDLFDPDFQEYLIARYNPYIFINNAATLSKNINAIIKMNGHIAVDLLMKFYQKMNNGIIINIGSISAEKANIAKETDMRIAYAISKKFLKDASLAISYAKNKPIKVMCLSPAATNTDMLKNLTTFSPNADAYEKYDWTTSIAWMKPEEVASIVRFMINLPPWISMPEVVLDNHYSSAINW